MSRQRRTCSKKCFYKFWTKKIIKPCDFCKKEISVSAFRLKDNKHHFCNRKCGHEWEKISKVKFPELRDKNWCMKTYKNKSLAKIAQQLGCGETTVFKWFKIHGIELDRKQWLRGEKHYLWQGGITKFCRQIRNCSEYKKWRRAVLLINPEICKMCGATDRLEVDHIKQLKFILIDNNIQNIEDARKCQELWEVKNGRILCRRCNLICANLNRKLFSTNTPK